jgi:transcriptional regulator with XRE-family HTH domain
VVKTVREGFAERLKLALEEAGYGESQQKELGRLFSVTPQAVRKWLAGEAMPTAEHAPLVAEKLCVRRAWLLDNELPMRPRLGDMAESGQDYAADAFSLSKDEFRLLLAYRSLPRRLRRLVEQLAEGMRQELSGVCSPAETEDTSISDGKNEKEN